jgi:hypothetical protein
MLNIAHRLPPEDPIPHPVDETPLDAYSRAVAAVVDRAGQSLERLRLRIPSDLKM